MANRAYKFRIYPDDEQKILFAKTFALSAAYTILLPVAIITNINISTLIITASFAQKL